MERSVVVSDQTCPQCGRPLDQHNRHIRFRLPDPVLSSPEQDRVARAWKTDDDPSKAVMMQIPNIGPFVWCLLPVHLSEGFSVTFGVWMAVHPDELQRIARVWHAPEYSDLKFDCWIANEIPRFGLLGTPASAAVRDPDATPYIETSTDTKLREVLTKEWPHEDILGSLPGSDGSD